MTHELNMAVVVQARLGSQRLPGKVLTCVQGKPLLQHLLDRLAALAPMPVVVATSDHPSDDPLARYCHQVGASCVRGPLENVAARYLQAVEELGLDAFVRVCGDSPLLDVALINRALNLFIQERAQVVTNVLPRTFPKGQSVEVVCAKAFAQAVPRMTTPKEREHVLPYFYARPGRYRLLNFSAGQDLSHLQLSVDTYQDLRRVDNILRLLPAPHWRHGLKAVLAAYRQSLGLDLETEVMVA